MRQEGSQLRREVGEQMRSRRGATHRRRRRRRLAAATGAAASRAASARPFAWGVVSCWVAVAVRAQAAEHGLEGAYGRLSLVG